MWGSSSNLTENQQIPITVEYFQIGGDSILNLRVKGPDNIDQEVPVKWLTPKAAALPDAWQLGVNVDGNVSYERLRVVGSNAVLEDSTRATHEYVWTGGGYKPPVNEDGQLTRNANNTYTFVDTDGRTYVFDVEGKLTSLTSATDDRNPANLKYEYAGDPSRLMKITDGVTSTRYGSLYYKSINDDATICPVPSGFDAAPTGMLCAFKTSDGDITRFYYKSTQLSRIEKPGGEKIDYGYDPLGRIISTRDSVANDAIAASVRADDASMLTETTYDNLGRILSVKAPAPTAGATRVNHRLEYLISATQLHIDGTTEPNGFSKRVEYDNLLRTTKETDVTNMPSMTEWDSVKDLELSKTDATGLKSTTIYDDEDRPIESYGPAPTAWYETSGANVRKPLANYASQVPKTSSGYDEGLIGPAVSWYNVKGSSLFGAPKLITQGIDQSDKSLFRRDFTSNTVPFTPDTGMDGYGLSATGKIRFPGSGTYTLKLWHDDGAKLSIDDQSIFNDWDYRSEGITQDISTGTFTAVAGKVYRFKLDYLHIGNPGAFELWWAGPGITDTNNGLGTSKPNFVTPDYSLKTSETSYDSQLGNVTRLTAYSRPEYGLVDRTTIDPAGLNLQSTATYETPGSGFLRQIAKTSAGGTTTTYLNYGAADSRDNPCTATVESYPQAGRYKGKVDTDPDASGPQTSRTSETIYNASGDVVATRYNNDPWTCTEYDSRGRISRTIVPQLSQYQPARTIVNDYAVGGNPLITSTTDDAGKITVENDLSGRTVKYIDARGNITTSAYDTYGKLTQRTSPIGNETFTYDQYDRLTDQKLDNTVYAHITYDAYSRIDNVTYPDAGAQKVQYGRDILGRMNNLTYTTNTSSGAGANLINNPSLETSTSTPALPTGWSDGSYGNNTRSLTYETTGRTGSRSVKAQISAYTDGDAKWAFSPATITSNTSYTFTDYYKSSITSKVVAQITLQDNSVSYIYLGSSNASASAWAQATYTLTTPANAAKIIVFHLIDQVGWLQIDDVNLNQTSGSASTATLSDSVTRATSGDVLSGTENGIAKSYTYDKAGRLTTANIGSNTFSYEFGTPTASCSGLTGNNTNASKNGNRTRMTLNGVVTTYCYDQADRLISSSDANYGTLEYDAHGNTTQLNSTLHPVYDASDRSRGIEEYTSSGNGKAVYYDRDAQSRIISRSTNSITNWSWQSTGTVNYGFTGTGDTPDFLTDTSGIVQEKYISLPGDVVVTIRPSEPIVPKKTTYSLSNIHGDIFATTNTNGELIAAQITGPFGEVLPSQPLPNNTAAGTAWSYVGKNEKMTETTFSVQLVQMGARVYIPGLGRFLSVDPIEGGTENNYVYSNEPVGSPDLDGKFIPIILGILFVANLAYSAYEAKKDPSPQNMLFLGLAVIPGGGGVAVKSVSLIAKNAARGAKVEKAVATAIKVSHPLHRVETARSATGVKTPMGMRYSDILATNRLTGKVTRYEVKSGGARYNSSQKAKDQWIKANMNQRTKCIRISTKGTRC